LSAGVDKSNRHEAADSRVIEESVRMRETFSPDFIEKLSAVSMAIAVSHFIVGSRFSAK
jgi:hypothetical protein